MSIEVNDVVEVDIAGVGNDPKRTVLGIVTEAPKGNQSAGTVSVMVGADHRGPQIVDTQSVRRLASRATIPWHRTDTQEMLLAASRKLSSTQGQASPHPTTAPTPRVPVTLPPSRCNAGTSAPVLRNGKEEPSAALSTSLSVSYRSFNTCSASDGNGGLARQPGEPTLERQLMEVSGDRHARVSNNALRVVCAVTDSILCGASLTVSATAFGLLTLWVMTCSLSPDTLHAAVAKLFIAIAGVVVGVAAQPTHADPNDDLTESLAALYRLILVVAIVGVASSSLVASGLLLAVLLTSCALAFDQRERCLP